MAILLPLLIILLGIFTQSLTGFGSGLVSMAFLPNLVGVRTAAPLVSLVTGTLEVLLLLRYRASFNFSAVWRLMAASVVAIPIGVWALRSVNEAILLTCLGLVIAGYALYALSNLRLPRLEQPIWGYGLGFVAGLLSGAYSTGGPPAIIYGSCRRWEPAEFKSNLQGFFLVNDALTIVLHGVAGNLTPEVWRLYGLAVPVVLIGMVAGSFMDRFISPQLFRKLALILLAVMGLRMIFFH
jgi:uncharacterized membrane protein YfcA